MRIYPDENSLLKQFTNNNNEIVIENTNEQYQKYLTAPSEAKHITNSEKIREEIRNKIEQIFINKNLKCRILERGQVQKYVLPWMREQIFIYYIRKTSLDRFKV